MEELLKYQSIDLEISKLEKSIKSCEYREVMNKMMGFVKDAQSKSLILEKNAKDLVDEYQVIKCNYEKVYKIVQSTVKNDANDMSAEQISKCLSDINSLSSELFMLERKLNTTSDKIKKILSDFEQTKNNVVKAKMKYKEAKQKYDEYVAGFEPQIEEKKKELEKIEKSIDKDLLAKYRLIKHENALPVIVKLNGKLCGACRMELPSKELDKLKNAKYVVCEQCGRLIIND